MAKAQASDNTSEILQIVILTLGMTAAGFLILWLVLKFYMIPKVERQVRTERGDYTKLVKLLDSEEMKLLQQQAKEQAEANQDRRLGEIMVDELESYGLEHERLPRATERPVGNITKISRQVVTKPAPLVKLLQYAMSVQDANKTIKIERLKIDRARKGRSRSGSDEPEDSWVADIEFVDFRSEAG